MILYFSGTGNSRWAARRLGEILGDEVVSINRQLRTGEPGRYDSELPYVIAAPVYGWRLPRVVEKFLSEASLGGSRDIYFVMTCGGGVCNTGKYLRPLCKKIGKTFRGIGEVKMPKNYVALYPLQDEETQKKLMEAAGPKIDALGQLIAEGKDFPEIRPTMDGRFRSSIVNPCFYAMFVSPKRFYATDRCTGCGLCASLCPLGNISLKDKKPVWGRDCTHCMACISACPAGAIEFGKKTVGRKRYYLK